MSRKAQFFIISAVAMSIALTVILGLLTVPPALTLSNLQSQSRDLHDFQETISNIKSLTNSLYDNWPLQQSSSAGFTIRNNNGLNAYNNEVIVKVLVDEYAENNTFQLVSNGEYLDASYALIKPGELIISFKDSFEKGESRNYRVFYNLESDAEKKLVFQEQRSRYDETLAEVRYYSPTYEAIISKSTGVITSLVIKGDDIDLSTAFKARVRTSSDYDQDSMTATVSILKYENNVLVVNVSGQIEPNTYLTQYYYFQPDIITLRQDFIISSAGDYNLSYVADVASSLNSLAYRKYANNSLSLPSETIFDSYNHHTVYKTSAGIGFIYEQDSLVTAQTPSGVDTRIQLVENSYTPNTITQEIIIMPYFNNYNYSIIAANNYNTNPLQSAKISKTEYLTYASNPIITSMTGSSSTLVFQQLFNESLNPQIIVAKNAAPSITPFSFTAKSFKEKDLNTLELNADYGLTTKNYHNGSYTNFYAVNQENQGITSTDYEMINLNGEDFSLGIRMNSETLTDTLDIEVVSPNNTLVLRQTLSPAIAGVFEEHDFTVKGYNVSGVYTLNVEGEDVVFSISTTLPLININAPFVLNATTDTVLYFEAGNDYTIKCESFDGLTSQVIINNTHEAVLSENLNFTRTINHTYYTTTPYYMHLKQGITLIDANLKFGSEDYYLNPDYEVKFIVEDKVLGKNYYTINASTSTTNKTVYYENMTYSFSTNTLTNKDYEWDFDTETLTYKGSNNWLYNGDFYACTGTYGSCTVETTSFTFDSLIENTTLFKSASFSSNTIKPLVRVFNASNLFMIELENPTKLPYTFGINYRIGGDDDTYYKTSYLEDEISLTSTTVYSSTIINNTGWNYIGKRDDSASTGLVFNSKDLKQGINSMVISDDYLRIGLNGFSTHVLYFFIGEDWTSIEAVVNSLNNAPVCYDEVIQYSYDYYSENLDSSAVIIG
ncbi:MAG: hypothetical protein JW791_02315 [Nanoarchaeota archaeon]|nr:hypothetical protein [Nanoarchaeota archaeon]